MKIIISSSVEFITPEDVLDYEALDTTEIPEDDVAPILNAVNYKVGYKHITNTDRQIDNTAPITSFFIISEQFSFCKILVK